MRARVAAALVVLALAVSGCSKPSGKDDTANEAPAIETPVQDGDERPLGPPTIEVDGDSRVQVEGNGVGLVRLNSSAAFTLVGGGWVGNDTVPLAERQTLVILRPMGVAVDGPCHSAPPTLLAWHTAFGGGVNWPNIPAGSYALQGWASAGGSVVLDIGAPDGDTTPVPVRGLPLGSILPVNPYIDQTAGPEASASFTEPIESRGTSLFLGRFDTSPTASGPESSVTSGVRDAAGRTCDEAAMVGNPASPNFLRVDLMAIVGPGNHTWSGSSTVSLRAQTPAMAFGFVVPLGEV